jgi:hypothetical protein
MKNKLVFVFVVFAVILGGCAPKLSAPKYPATEWPDSDPYIDVIPNSNTEGWTFFVRGDQFQAYSDVACITDGKGNVLKTFPIDSDFDFRSFMKALSKRFKNPKGVKPIKEWGVFKIHKAKQPDFLPDYMLLFVTSLDVKLLVRETTRVLDNDTYNFSIEAWYRPNGSELFYSQRKWGWVRPTKK